MVGNDFLFDHVEDFGCILVIFEIETDIHRERGTFDDFVKIDEIDIIGTEYDILIQFFVNRFDRLVERVEIVLHIPQFMKIELCCFVEDIMEFVETAFEITLKLVGIGFYFFLKFDRKLPFDIAILFKSYNNNEKNQNNDQCDIEHSQRKKGRLQSDNSYL